MKQAVRRFFKSFFPAIAYFVLVFFLFRNAVTVQKNFTTYSLRFDEDPINTSAVDSARKILNNPNKTFDFSACFWSNQTALDITATNNKKNLQTRSMLVNGDMSTAMPVYFLHGDYPSPTDGQGVAMSEELAWQLWGGINVVGEEIEWGGQKYFVRGVFEEKESLLLIQIDTQKLLNARQSSMSEDDGLFFHGVELKGDVQGDENESINAFMSEIGIYSTGTIFNTRNFSTLAFAMAWLPAAMLIVWFLAKVLLQIRMLGFWPRQVVLFGVLIGLAMLLPTLMDLLPSWMIPTQWSNMQHWETTIKEVNTRFTNVLMRVPSLKDLQLKKQLLLQLGLMIPCMFAIMAAIRAWRDKFNGVLQRLSVQLPEVVEVDDEMAEDTEFRGIEMLAPQQETSDEDIAEDTEEVEAIELPEANTSGKTSTKRKAKIVRDISEDISKNE